MCNVPSRDLSLNSEYKTRLLRNRRFSFVVSGEIDVFIDAVIGVISQFNLFISIIPNILT